MTSNSWPELPLAEWKDTFATLHMWTQIVGKIRLKLTPLENHWWNVTLYVTSRGLSTSIMSYKGRHFQMDFDFIAHHLLIESSDGSRKTVILRPMSVAEFYRETIAALESLGISINIWTTPTEVSDRIPFEQDRKHASYDPKYANRFWRILVESTRVLREFRSRFIGKVSPIHFFWGGFDLAVTCMFLLPYDVVRTAKSPDDVLLSFLQGTYEAAATSANWDRHALERQ
jgi:hypothetical protein